MINLTEHYFSTKTELTTGEQIALVICVPLPQWETHIPSEMCVPISEHISPVIYVPLPRKHISIVICVPR